MALAKSFRYITEIQRRWLHLESVFVRKTLPENQETFEKADKEFTDIMIRLNDQGMAATASELNEEQLDKIQQRLDQLNRVLNVFLEEKRNKFSRFCFIGQASEDATIIQAHLKKLFQGVHSVVFEESST